MSVSNICHLGIINEISNHTLFVEIERLSACAACHAKNSCMAFGKKNQIIEVPINKPDNFQIGEKVQVNINQTLGGKAVVIAYLCPFLTLTIGLFATYYFTKNELLSVGVGFVATTFFYLFIKKIDHKLQKQFSFTISKINN